MSKQQTAVEWLYNKLSTCTSDELIGNINNWFQQAKQMEAEQLQAAFNAGREFGCKHDDPETGEQYYNETYAK